MFFVERDYATLFLDGSTLFIIITILILSAPYQTKKREDDRAFFLMLLTNCIVAAADTVSYIFYQKGTALYDWLSAAGNTVFYIGFVAISMLLVRYAHIRFHPPGTPVKHVPAMYIPGIVVMALILFNPLTHWFFFYDDVGAYYRGPLFLLIYVVFTIYIMAGFGYIARYRSKRSGQLLIPVWFYAISTVFGVCFTFFVPGSASFAPIAIAVSISFTHMGSINEALDISYGRRVK